MSLKAHHSSSEADKNVIDVSHKSFYANVNWKLHWNEIYTAVYIHDSYLTPKFANTYR